MWFLDISFVANANCVQDVDIDMNSNNICPNALRKNE